MLFYSVILYRTQTCTCIGRCGLQSPSCGMLVHCLEHLLPTDISGFLVPSVHCLLQSLMWLYIAVQRWSLPWLPVVYILMAHETPQLQCYNCAIEWECNVCSVQMEMVTLWTDCIMCSVTFTVVKTILYLCHVHWSVTWNSLWFPLLRLQPICFDLSTAIVIQTLQLPPLVVHSVHCDIELCALHMYSMYIG